jgi:hypothetical protein
VAPVVRAGVALDKAKANVIIASHKAEARANVIIASHKAGGREMRIARHKAIITMLGAKETVMDASKTGGRLRVHLKSGGAATSRGKTLLNAMQTVMKLNAVKVREMAMARVGDVTRYK